MLACFKPGCCLKRVYSLKSICGRCSKGKNISHSFHLKRLTFGLLCDKIKLQIGEGLIRETKNEYGKTVVRR